MLRTSAEVVHVPGRLPRSPAAPAEWVIEPRRTGLFSRIVDVWQYRRLLPFFGARVMEKMYRRTVLGWLWVVIRPLVNTAAFFFAFSAVLGVKSDSATPYFLVLLVANTCWATFESCLIWCTRSLELNREMMRSMYFPRLLLPFAGTTPGVVESGISLITVTLTVIYLYISKGTCYVIWGPNLLVAVVALLFAYLLAVAIGFFTSVLGANARDVRFTLSYVTRMWIFITPVAYPASSIPQKLQWLLKVNPMSPLVEQFKWGVLGYGSFAPTALLVTCGVIMVLFVAGLLFFDHAEGELVDKI